MNFGIHPLLLVTFLPLVGVLVILFLKNEQKKAIRWTALIASLATFGARCGCFHSSRSANPACSSNCARPGCGWTAQH